MKYKPKEITFKNLKEMPPEQRPREKMRLQGVRALSDIELICSILGRGQRNRSVQDIATGIYENALMKENITLESLMKIDGLGEAGASAICAALELGRRFAKPRKTAIKSAEDAFLDVRHFGSSEQEHLICIVLNGAMEILETKVITVGLVNKTVVHPREVYANAIKLRATAIIIAHNHPSGNLEPSAEDLQVTEKICQAGKLLGIELLDHIIFSSSDYCSLKEKGLFYSFI